jgi:hypothetical protein
MNLITFLLLSPFLMLGGILATAIVLAYCLRRTKGDE